MLLWAARWQTLLLVWTCWPVSGVILTSRQPQENRTDVVHVVWASDAGGFSGLQRGMISLGRNLHDPAACTLHLIVPHFDMPAAEQLVSCVRRELSPFNITASQPRVIIHELKPFPISVPARMRNPAHALGFARLFLDDYLTDVDRVVWLDTDTIITSDIKALFDRPMAHPLAAVREGPPRSFRVLYGLWLVKLMGILQNPDQLIFNAGVMVIDLRRWRSERVADAIRYWAEKLPSAGAQLLLNVVFQVGRNFTELPEQWNVFGLGGVFPPRLEQAQHAFVLHWSGPNKPWTRDTQVQTFNPGFGLPPLLFKAGVHLPNLGHEQFDFLAMPYIPKRQCTVPAFVPM